MTHFYSFFWGGGKGGSFLWLKKSDSYPINYSIFPALFLSVILIVIKQKKKQSTISGFRLNFV